MSDRDDAIRPIAGARLTPLTPERETRRDAEAQSRRDAEPKARARYDTYRVILDPETLRAVAQVRDPETGEVMFTVPPGAELSEEAERRLGANDAPPPPAPKDPA